MAAPQVFLSHTSELREFPAGGSFVAAAEKAILQAGDAVMDMEYFTAGDDKPSDFCRTMVGSCDVYVGLIGLRYGSRVQDQPGVSYTELEFEAATEAGISRLVFLIDDAELPRDSDPDLQVKQQAFRDRLRRAEITIAKVDDPDDLEKKLFRALLEGRQQQVGRDGKRPELDQLADHLAEAVREQWKTEAGKRGLVGAEQIPVSWGRPARALAGPTAAAAGSQEFGPLPGVPVVSDLPAAGQIGDLHAIYGGLRSGRLVIAGAPGSGKSGVAVQLVLAALKHREQVTDRARPWVPVPVLFTAHDWELPGQRIHDWLAEQMRQTYGLFAGKTGAAKAADLIKLEKVALILDGLDEIATELRDFALQALSAQNAFRVVVCCRTDEMESAASIRPLPGAAAVELQAIGSGTAADYLRRIQRDPPPDGWRDLIDRLRSGEGSPLAHALDNPLNLTLVKDTYRAGDNARELLDYCDAAQRQVSGDRLTEVITGYLLDQVLPIAYPERSGDEASRYDPETAKHVLAKIATQMNQFHTRDLQWWLLRAWVPVAPRAIFTGVVFGLVPGLAGLVFGLHVGIGIGPGFLAGLTFGLFGGLWVWFLVGPPHRIGKLTVRRVLRSLGRRGLVVALGTGIGIGIALGVGAGVMAGLGAWLAAGLGLGLAVIEVLGLGLLGALANLDDTNSPSPIISWRNDRKHALVTWVVVAVTLGVPVGILTVVVAKGPLGTGTTAAIVAATVTATVTGVEAGLVFWVASSAIWSSSLAAVQLALRWHRPVYLIRFLDDARERNVLRTVGPVYQFRHARLQDRLAKASDDSGNDSNTTSRPDQVNNPPGHQS